MKQPASPLAQSGAVLAIGLIMLALIMLVVAASFTLSTTNLKSVGNMQARNEAIAAANLAIEQVAASPFFQSPSSEQVSVDIDHDGTNDYVVDFEVPQCIRAALTVCEECQTSGQPPASFYTTVWELRAEASDNATGAVVRVRQGVTRLLTESQYNALCAS